MDDYLFNIYTLPGLIFVISCYTFPYIFVLVANALDRIPGDLEDASSASSAAAPGSRRDASRFAYDAGALSRRPDRIPAGHDPVRLARHLALPAGFHTMTTKIWSLFQFPPTELARQPRCRCSCSRSCSCAPSI